MQVVAVTLANAIELPRDHAPTRAVDAVRSHTPAGMAPGVMRAESDATLVIGTVGRSSRFAYDVVITDGERRPYRVRLDAAAGTIHRAVPLFANVNCNPDTTVYSSAEGVPTRYNHGLLTLRSLATTNTAYNHLNQRTQRADGQIWEGSYAWSSQVVVNVFHQTTNANWTCFSGGKNYTLFPLTTSSGATGQPPAGTPLYENYSSTNGTWLGRNAGDALHFTKETMLMLDSFGRDGWDGAGAPAEITVGIASGTPTFADWDDDERGPRGVIMPIINPNEGYAWEAALDVVAHEWGHGIVWSQPPYGPGLQYTGVGEDLHEGFGDVIGHMAEKTRQSGSGLEGSDDWKIGEDALYNSNWVRRADYDDGPGGARFHAADTSAGSSAWEQGNMMHVAFRVLVDGGKTPYCVNNGTAAGCSLTNQGLGIQRAGQIVTYALSNTIGSTDGWGDIADRLRTAAKFLYTNCSDSTNPEARTEIDQIGNAFSQIGYPPTQNPANQCGP